MGQEILEISDDASRDTKIVTNKDDSPAEVAEHELINRSKLRVDARKWLMSKIAPKKYGDRVAHEHGDPDGNPLQPVPALYISCTVEISAAPKVAAGKEHTSH